MIKGRDLTLTNNSKIAIIGGGPAGAFFSIFASKLAHDLGKQPDITIYERKTFVNQGAAGCNMCAGVISESMVQLLALEGINLPTSVVQWGIDSYYFHTLNGSTRIKSSRLHQQRGIATIYRGGGPTGSLEKGIQSFDDFLLGKASELGARVQQIMVDKICLDGDKPVLYSDGNALQGCDLLVGAFGIKANTAKLFERLPVGYTAPSTIKATQSEIELGTEWIANHFGNSIHIFLLHIPGVKFVSIIPKGDYVTVSLLGEEPKVDHVKAFLNHPFLKKMLPPDFRVPEKFCRCFPKINVKAAMKPFADRLVFVGDASSARLYKDGIGSAYITAKAAAHTAILFGVGEESFRSQYLPTCKTLDWDNRYGQFLFKANDWMTNMPPVSRGYFEMIQKEQGSSKEQTPCSNILWDMFTGSRFYKDVFLRAINPCFILSLLGAVIISFFRKGFICCSKKWFK